MIGFHIDMNMAQYRADYLRRWLRVLARRGYDTVLWEVENNIRWETCPECCSPDAFTKAEFRQILQECRDLGLEPVPLFQTIGHAEYVLKHAAYAHLKELPDHIDQYCPRHPAVTPFLLKWIEEYLDVFGDVRQFHLGADEAWILGSCPACKAYAEQTSLSQLYIDHINPLAESLIEKGITPAIWADMLLHYPEALERLSRKIVMYDWMYEIYRGSGKVKVWGDGFQSRKEFTPAFLERFGGYVFPHGDEPAREPETFYTADFLSAQGFKVVTCPASSNYGDNVFSPRSWLHLVNTFDSFQKGLAAHQGSLLTSWSVHLHPWELQLAEIDIPAYLQSFPKACREDFQDWFMDFRFGCQSAEFWQAGGLLSKACLFTNTSTLGYSKSCLPVPPNHVEKTLRQLQSDQRIESEYHNCLARLKEYRQAADLLHVFSEKAPRGQEWLAYWDLAARSLINRAQVSALLLEHSAAFIQKKKISGEARQHAVRLLAELRALRSETQMVYQEMIRPTRCAEMIDYMYGAVEIALAEL